MGGLFIAFEGLDGCGKSTQIALLEDALAEAGHDLLTLREPGGTPVGEQIRSLLLDPATGDIDPTTEAYLYASSRAELVRCRIIPHLEAGGTVLCDRFVDSSIAYQGAGRALSAAWVMEINTPAVGTTWPDLTVLLDLDAATSLARSRDTGEADRIEQESLGFFERVRSEYTTLARRSPERYLVVDATQSPDAIHEQITTAIAAARARKSTA